MIRKGAGCLCADKGRRRESLARPAKHAPCLSHEKRGAALQKFSERRAAHGRSRDTADVPGWHTAQRPKIFAAPCRRLACRRRFALNHITHTPHTLAHHERLRVRARHACVCSSRRRRVCTSQPRAACTAAPCTPPLIRLAVSKVDALKKEFEQVDGDIREWQRRAACPHRAHAVLQNATLPSCRSRSTPSAPRRSRTCRSSGTRR